MTDQTPTIPADKVRDLRDQYTRLIEDAGTKETRAYYGHVVKDLDALLPAPPRPTLADMTVEERLACQWMKADMEGEVNRAVIVNPRWEDGIARVLWSGGFIDQIGWERVTPRPDLPRMEWPGNTPHKGPKITFAMPAPAPALPEGWRLADHWDHGRVIVTNTTPNSGGNVYFVLPDSLENWGYGWGYCPPADLTYLDTDQGGDTSDAVPESTLAVGSEWHDADALTRACEETGRDQIIATDRADNAYVWVEAEEWWAGSRPLAADAPFTILHAGKKADQ